MLDSLFSQVFESDLESAVGCDPLDQLPAGRTGILLEVRISPGKVRLSIDIITSTQLFYRQTLIDAQSLERAPEPRGFPRQATQIRPRSPGAHQRDAAVCCRTEHDVKVCQCIVCLNEVIAIEARRIGADKNNARPRGLADDLVYCVNALAEIARGLRNAVGSAVQQVTGPIDVGALGWREHDAPRPLAGVFKSSGEQASCELQCCFGAEFGRNTLLTDIECRPA